MLEGARRGLRAHVRAPLRAGCCLPPPPTPLLLLQAAPGTQGLAELLEPAVGRGAPGCALHSVAERRGSLWGRQGGGGWGGNNEERGGETGSAFPAQVEKGRAPHLSRNMELEEVGPGMR